MYKNKLLIIIIIILVVIEVFSIIYVLTRFPALGIRTTDIRYDMFPEIDSTFKPYDMPIAIISIALLFIIPVLTAFLIPNEKVVNK